MEGTVNKAAGLVFLLCRCGDRDFHVYCDRFRSNDNGGILHTYFAQWVAHGALAD